MLTDSQNGSERVLNLKKDNSNAGTAAPARPASAAAKRMKLEDTRFQCVVCQSSKVSLSELHWHQTYQHSTEELSLSVIGWKGLVKIVSAPKKSSSSQMEKENTEQRSIWSSLSKKPSQFYYLSSSILRVNGDQGDNTESPIDCTVQLSKARTDDEIAVHNGLLNEVEPVEEVIELETEDVEEEEVEEGVQEVEEEVQEVEEEVQQVEEEVQEVEEEIEEVEEEEEEEEEERDRGVQIAIVPKSCSVPLVRVERYIDIPIVPKEVVVKGEVESEEEEELRGFEKSSIDVSLFDRFIDMRVLKKELCWTREISMEDFVRSANGLCHELEDYKRLSALKKSLRRKNIL